MIIVLAGIIYPQDSTSFQVLQRYADELSLILDKVQHKVDSLEIRCKYLESLLSPVRPLFTIDGNQLYTFDGKKLYAKKD